MTNILRRGDFPLWISALTRTIISGHGKLDWFQQWYCYRDEQKWFKAVLIFFVVGHFFKGMKTINHFTIEDFRVTVGKFYGMDKEINISSTENICVGKDFIPLKSRSTFIILMSVTFHLYSNGWLDARYLHLLPSSSSHGFFYPI